MRTPARIAPLLLATTCATLPAACAHREPHSGQNLAATAGVTATTTTQGQNIARTPKDEATDLMNMLVPLAEKHLREHGEFYPYGGAMLRDGSMQLNEAYDGNEHPKSKDVYDLLVAGFQKDAQDKYKATGIVYDVTILPPGATEKTDAIAVRLDHRDGYSVIVMIPYRLVGAELTTGTLFAVKGDGGIFPAK